MERVVRKSQWDDLSPSKKKRHNVLGTFDINRQISSQMTLKSSHAIINESNQTVRMHAKVRNSNQPETGKLAKLKMTRFTPRVSTSDCFRAR